MIFNINLGFNPKVMITVLLYYIISSDAKNKYNVSLSQMATCKEYDLRGIGYIYADFFLVHSLENNKMANGERLHLKFYVMTAMDAHILLSVNDSPRLADRVYEVVIGAGGNTFSTIRASMGRRRVATNQDPQLLSIFDPTPIEIVQKNDGNLQVYIPGFKEGPLMNYTDASPLNINYISFSTFGSITAKWFYDCQFDGFIGELEEEIRPLTPQQRLIANITAKASNYTVPDSLKFVNFAFQIRSVAFIQKTSILQTRLHMILYWTDPALIWNPQDFNNIGVIVQPTLNIWTPKLLVLNGALTSLNKLKTPKEIKIYANGSVSLMASNVELTTWCLNVARHWPHDRLQCEIVLGLAQLPNVREDTIALEYDVSKPLSNEPVSTLSEWQFMKITVGKVVTGGAARLDEIGKLQIMEHDVSIAFLIQRNSQFYKNVFAMPILACHTLVVLSFLLRGYRRGALLLVVLVVIVLGFMFITRHAPTNYVPNIMIAYQNVMRITTTCYLLHIVICWLELYPPKGKPTNWTMAIINSTPLRLVLCIRFTDSSEYCEIQEHPWREIAKMLNNTSFILINILLILNDALLLPGASS